MPVDDIVEIHCLIGRKDRFHINEECFGRMERQDEAIGGEAEQDN